MSRLGAVGTLVVAVIGFRMAGWMHGGSNYYAPGPSFTGTLLEIVGVLVVAVICLGVAGWLLGGGYYEVACARKNEPQLAADAPFGGSIPVSAPAEDEARTHSSFLAAPAAIGH